MAEQVDTQQKRTTASGGYDELIERIPEMEDTLKIRMDAVSAIYDRPSRCLSIYCEIHPATGTKLSFDTKFNAVIYDVDGRIIDRTMSTLWKDNFFGLEVLELLFTDISPKIMGSIEKIKVFPTKL